MIVYRHRESDTGKIFYIGIGSDKYRATSFKNRTKLWKNVYKKHGIVVEIIAENLDKETACELEEFLIEIYGRRCEGVGNLVNFASGGNHFNHCNESKNKMRDIANRRSKDILLKIKENIPRGGRHVNAKIVKNKITGIEYSNIKEASEAEKINYSTLRNNLSGSTIKNRTNIEYIIN